MPFAKDLQRANGDYTLSVTGGAANTSKTAITVTSINSMDRIREADTLSAAPGAQASKTAALPAGTSRVTVEVALPIPDPGGVSEATVTLTQANGGGNFNQTINQDTLFVFDVVA